MTKYKQWKETLKNVPPDRLLKINMQGYILQSIGIIVVCIILIYTKLVWWLIFVFIFGLWNNYSGFVTSYQQYNQIRELRKELNLPEKKLVSPHLKKVKLIKERFGRKAGWTSVVVSVLFTYLFVGDFSGIWWIKTLKVLFAFILMLSSYYILYFIIFYKLARRAKNG